MSQIRKFLGLPQHTRVESPNRPRTSRDKTNDIYTDEASSGRSAFSNRSRLRMNRSLEINRDRVGLNVSQTYIRQLEEANQNFIKQHRTNTSNYEQIQKRLEETERQRIEALRRAEEAEYQRRTQQDLVLIADRERREADHQREAAERQNNEIEAQRRNAEARALETELRRQEAYERNQQLDREQAEAQQRIRNLEEERQTAILRREHLERQRRENDAQQQLADTSLTENIRGRELTQQDSLETRGQAQQLVRTPSIIDLDADGNEIEVGRPVQNLSYDDNSYGTPVGQRNDRFGYLFERNRGAANLEELRRNEEIQRLRLIQLENERQRDRERQRHIERPYIEDRLNQFRYPNPQPRDVFVPPMTSTRHESPEPITAPDYTREEKFLNSFSGKSKENVDTWFYKMELYFKQCSRKRKTANSYFTYKRYSFIVLSKY